MKKTLSALYLALLIPLLMPGCTENTGDPRTLLTALCSLFSDEYGPAVLYSAAEHEGFKHADSTLLGRLYTGKFEAPACYPRITDFALRLPLDDSGFEIHIIKCVNRSDTEEISSLLMRRIDTLQSAEILDYAPESYERYFKSAEIFIYGNTVFLLATPDNSAVKNAIKKHPPQ